MIHKLKKEILQVLKKDVNNISITFVGSVNKKKIKYISDIDVVVICKKLTKKYYQDQIESIKKLDEDLYKPTFKQIYINDTFGPLKYNTNGNLVIHLMIYDLESHKNHVIESPFTCLDWNLYNSSYGPNLRDIFPVLNLQILDFKTARRNIDDYRFEFKERKLSFREYEFSSNTDYVQIKKYKQISDVEVLEFMFHILKFSIFNLYKFIKNKNKIFKSNDIFKDLKEFRKFEPLFIKLDRSKSDLNKLNIDKVTKEFYDFLNFYDGYLLNLEKEIEKNCFYLVRHSETDLNDGSFLGIGRNPGVASLMNKKILSILKSTKVLNYFSSPMKRAVETAEQITKKYILSELIQEINYGKAEGMTPTELGIAYPEIKKAWDNGQDVNFPDGENTSEVLIRVQKFLRKNKNNIPFMAFTHQVVIRVTLSSVFGLNINLSHFLNIKHEYPYKFYFDKNKIRSATPRKDIYSIFHHE